MQITLTLNDKKLTADVAPDTLLIDFVRSHGCLSVKRGCETSNCGLCTVFLDDKPVLFIFGCGVLVGIFGVVKLIRKALDHFRAQTIYLIIGLMLGSIYAVVMGPTTLEVPQPAMTLHDFNILFFVIGGALIIGLQKMKDLKA